MRRVAMRGLSLAAVTATALMIAATVHAADPVFVVASAANVRSHAAPTASIQVQLPIAVPLWVRERHGEWLQVALQPERAAIGWVHRDTVDAAQPTVATLRQQLEQAASAPVAVRRGLAERLAALDPAEPMSLTPLQTVLLELGDVAGLDGVRAAITVARDDQALSRPVRPQALFVLEEERLRPLARLDGARVVAWVGPKALHARRAASDVVFGLRQMPGGRRLAVFHQGVAAGSVVVTRGAAQRPASDTEGCYDFWAPARRSGAAPLGAALVADAGVRDGTHTAQAVDGATRARAQALATRALFASAVWQRARQPARKRYGAAIEPAVRAAVRLTSIAAVDLDRDGAVELVVTFDAAPGFVGALETSVAFGGVIIAPASASDHSQAHLTWIDGGDEAAHVSKVTAIDWLDFDGDGTAEVVIKSQHYEWTEYRVLQRRDGRWSAQLTASFGC